MLESSFLLQEAKVETDLMVELARFVERIAAIARTGLAFKPDGYDSERYEELLKEAARMHAALAQADPHAMPRRCGFDGASRSSAAMTVT